MSTRNSLPFSNQFERGHSFNWADKWQKGKYYFNNEYTTDFVIYNSCILACREDHLSDIEPQLVYQDGVPVDVEGNLWSFVSTFINHDMFRFVTWAEYQNLQEIEQNVLYFIYDKDE